MNLTATRSNISKSLSGAHIRSGTVYGFITVLAMIAFETFNYSTTAYSLQDLLGDLNFAGVPWSTFLALAFCGIDFAGIARLMTPGNRKTDLKESWYLFGAWLIAATANAALTWWGVAVALSGHSLKSSAVINLDTLTRIVPVFVAILVWVIRILIIASLSASLERRSTKQGSLSGQYPRENNTFRSSQPAQQSRAANPITMTRISHSTLPNRTEINYPKPNTQASLAAKEKVGNRINSF